MTSSLARTATAAVLAVAASQASAHDTANGGLPFFHLHSDPDLLAVLAVLAMGILSGLAVLVRAACDRQRSRVVSQD